MITQHQRFSSLVYSINRAASLLQINNFLQSGSVPLGDVNDSGYADIHVACRYNNRYALELLLNRGLNEHQFDSRQHISFPVYLCFDPHCSGVSKDLQDKNGNTCVHYASKYGHVDTCRLLIDKGCSPIVKNSSGQTPYDVAENHLIRQYLLPLQFQAERDSGVPVATPQVVPGPDSSPLYEAANSLMVPRPSYPGYMGSHPQFSQPLADSAPLPYAPLPQSFPSSSGAAPPLKSASPSLPGSHLAPSSVEPGPATQTAPLSVPSIPRPPIAGGVVVNKIQATNILPNKSPALNFESDSASPRAGDNSPSAAGVISSAPVQFMSPHRPVAAPAASVPGPPLVAAASSWAPPPAPHQAVGASSIRIIRPGMSLVPLILYGLMLMYLQMDLAHLHRILIYRKNMDTSKKFKKLLRPQYSAPL